MTDPAFTDYKTDMPVVCSGCGAELQGHLALQAGSGPVPESAVSICADCSALAVYTTVNGQLALRRPTDDEERTLLCNPRVLEALAALRVLREQRRGGSA